MSATSTCQTVLRGVPLDVLSWATESASTTTSLEDFFQHIVPHLAEAPQESSTRNPRFQTVERDTLTGKMRLGYRRLYLRGLLTSTGS